MFSPVRQIRDAIMTKCWAAAPAAGAAIGPFPPRSEPRRFARLILAPLALVVTVGLGHPSAVRAETIPYVISPGATFNVPDQGDTFGLSGTFDFDSVNPGDSTADITVTYGAYSETFTEVIFAMPDQFNIDDPANGDNEVSLQFYAGSSLAFALPDPLQYVDLGINDGEDVLEAPWSCCYWYGVPSAGSAADPVVPEPASLALLGSALASLAVIRRRKRKAS